MKYKYQYAVGAAMGWFAIAALAGAVAFYGFPGTWEWARVHWPRVVGIVVAPLIVCIVCVAYIPFIANIWHSGRVDDALGRGAFARILLGGILGYGVAYVVREIGTGKDFPTTGTKHTVHILGAAILLLAISAPHIDRWFSHLSSLSLPIGEIKLTTVSTGHRFLAPNTVKEELFDLSPIVFLYQLPQHMEQDEKYIDLVEKPSISRTDEPSATETLETASTRIDQLRLGVFADVHNLAACLYSAIEHGMSIDTARRDILPIAETLEQMIAIRATPSTGNDQTWNKHVVELQLLLSNVNEHASDFQMSNPSECHSHFKKPDSAKELDPELEKLSTFANPWLDPYLINVTAQLLLFGNNDVAALNILQLRDKPNSPWPKAQFPDYNLPYLIGRIMSYEGQPIREVQAQFQETLNLARDSEASIQAARAQCALESACFSKLATLDGLANRAVTAKFVAMNAFAMVIAQALAARLDEAYPYQAIMSEYAEALCNAGRIQNPPCQGPDNLRGDDRDEILDTVAFVWLVEEAQKTDPDRDKLRQIVVLLSDVVAHRRQPVESANAPVGKTTLQDLALFREHLALAQQLLDGD